MKKIAVLFCFVLAFALAQDSSSSSSTGVASSTSSSTASTDSSSSTGSSSSVSSSSSTGSNSTTPVTPTPSSSSTGTAARSNTTILPSTFPGTDFNITYCGLGSAPSVAAYDTVKLCIVVSGVAKMLFYPVVEDFSLLQISTPSQWQGSFDDPGTWFQLEYGGKASGARHRRPQISAGAVNTNYIVPFYTIIITLKDGVVDTIKWDDGCYGCSGDACVDGTTCAIEKSLCYVNGITCDPKVYLGWYGTDKNGRYLRSAGKRISRFRQYSLSTAFANAWNSAYDTVPGPENFGTSFTPSQSNNDDQVKP